MTETLPTDGDRCPTCGQRVERGWYGDDLTNGYFPVAERAARINLAVIERLREREAALVAGIALLLNWLDDEFVTAALPFRADEQIDSVRRLAADPSAPATTEETP